MLITLGVVIAGLAVLTLWRAAANEAAARADYPPGGRLVEIAGQTVHAVVMGEGPDLVLIHGSGGNLRDMTFSLAPELARNYRVIIFDRPGFGYSDRLPAGREGIAEQADLLVQAARHLGAERPMVLGHSYGGAVALAWAVYHRDAISALVPVAAPSHPWTTPLDPLYRITANPLGAAVVVPLISAFVTDARVDSALVGIFAPQPVPEGYSRHFGTRLSLRRSTLRANARQRAGLLEEVRALVPGYGAIAIPTEIVHGSADDTVSPTLHARQLVDAIPGAALTLVDGIGHMPQHVATGAVVAAVARAAARAGLR